MRRFLQLRHQTRTSLSDTVRVVTPTGDVRELEIISTNLLDDPAVSGVVVNGRDVTEQRASERARAEAERRDIETKLAAAAAVAQSEERFRLAFADNMAPMIIADLDDRAIAVNAAFCDLVGYTAEELLGNDSSMITHHEDADVSKTSREKILAARRATRATSSATCHKSGRVVVAEASRSAALDADGNPLYFVISERDVTDRVQHDHVMRLISTVNRLAVHAAGEFEFGQQLCSALVDVGGYALAWIGLSSPGRSRRRRILVFVRDTGYLTEGARTGGAPPRAGLGHAGIALASGTNQVVGDLTLEAPTTAWRERARRYGLASSVAIPDRFGDRPRGADRVLARRCGPSTRSRSPDSTRSFARRSSRWPTSRSVRDTARALEEATAAMAARSAAESALTESEQRFRLAFEGNMAPMVFTDLEDRVLAANDAFCDMVGFSREGFVGEDSRQFTFAEDVGITEDSHRHLLRRRRRAGALREALPAQGRTGDRLGGVAVGRARHRAARSSTSSPRNVT